MNSLLQRYVGAVVGFGFTAMWFAVGAFSAVMCLIGAVAFYCVVVVAQRRRLDVFTTRYVESATRKRRPAQRPQPSSRRERTEEPILVGDCGW